MNKCFDNIKSLLMKKNDSNKMEAHGMYSSEGEYVEYASPILLEGKISQFFFKLNIDIRL